jgi:hypothetical protein
MKQVWRDEIANKQEAALPPIDVSINHDVSSLIPTHTLREKGFASLSLRERERG